MSVVHDKSANHTKYQNGDPQTPLNPTTPKRGESSSVVNDVASHHFKRPIWIRWAVDPSASIKLLLLPILLYANWEFLSFFLELGISNPFTNIFLISGYLPDSRPDDPHYRKTFWDIAFLLYYVVFFSFTREMVAIYVSKPTAKYFELKRSKFDRFGEQTYALFYFTIFGAWGYRIMTQLPTYWYNTDAFWVDYPTWRLKPELKRYYLMQIAYWCQQMLILVLGVEKPRKDYWELVAHHLVTLWLVGWSYVLNLTWIGNAVYMSMDIPDAFLALSKLLNYIRCDTAKIYAFVVFFGVWTYFRHLINIKILWSVLYEFTHAPEWAKRWSWSEGVYLVGWMQQQIFLALFLLKLINMIWYYLIIRILVRAIRQTDVDDDRSDDEDEGDNDKQD